MTHRNRLVMIVDAQVIVPKSRSDPPSPLTTVLSALKSGGGPRAPADAAFALAVLASYAIHAGCSASDAINDLVS